MQNGPQTTSSTYNTFLNRIQNNDTTLTSIDLKDQSLTESQIINLFREIKKNQTITAIDLRNVAMSDKARDTICEALKNNYTLLSLQITVPPENPFFSIVKTVGILRNHQKEIDTYIARNLKMVEEFYVRIGESYFHPDTAQYYLDAGVSFASVIQRTDENINTLLHQAVLNQHGPTTSWLLHEMYQRNIPIDQLNKQGKTAEQLAVTNPKCAILFQVYSKKPEILTKFLKMPKCLQRIYLSDPSQTYFDMEELKHTNSVHELGTLNEPDRLQELAIALRDNTAVTCLKIYLDFECFDHSYERKKEYLRFLGNILRHNKYLKKIYFEAYKVDNYIEMVTEILEKNNLIITAVIQYDLKIESFQYLSEAIKTNTSLTSIYLGCLSNFPRIEEIKPICKALKTNHSITQLSFKSPNIIYKKDRTDVKALFIINLYLQRNIKFRELFHKAVIANDFAAIQQLLHQGVKLSFLSVTGDDENTPLHWAIIKNYKEMAVWIITKMSDLNIPLTQRNKQGKTAEQLALNNTELANLFKTQFITNITYNNNNNEAHQLRHLSSRVSSDITNNYEYYNNADDEELFNLLEKSVQMPDWLENVASQLSRYKLYLGWKNINTEAVKYIARIIQINTFFAIVDLGNNAIGAEGIKYLANGLKVNFTIAELSLNENKVDDEGAIYLSDMLRVNLALTEINLNDNIIGDRGVEFLSYAVEMNSTLRNLNLFKNKIKAEGAKYFAGALKINCTLMHFNLGLNKIGDIGAEYLAKMLKTNRSLIKINLDSNKITSEGARYLGEALKINSSLIELDLAYNELNDLGGNYICAGLEENNIIVSLNLSNNKINDEKILKKIQKYLKRNQRYRDKFHDAIKSNNFEAIQQLQKEGVKFSFLSRTGEDQNTPLHWAIIQNCREMAAWLIARMRDLKIPLTHPNKQGKTAEQLAMNNPELANLFKTTPTINLNSNNNNQSQQQIENSDINNNNNTNTNNSQIVNTQIVSFSLPVPLISRDTTSNSTEQEAGAGKSANNHNQMAGGDSHIYWTTVNASDTTQKAESSFQVIPWSDIKVLGEAIGSGSYGVVYQAIWMGSTVAVKELYLRKLSHLNEDFIKEVSIMSRLKFPNVVEFFGVCMEAGRYGIVMEFLPKGALYYLLKDNKQSLPWELRWKIAYGIVSGMRYLHESQKITHGDLKSLNILLDEKLEAKISDFGLSCIKSETATTTTSTQNKGSIRWLPPERFNHQPSQKPDPFKVDIWSIGMVLWEIATRDIPYGYEPQDMIVMMWIMTGTKPHSPQGFPVEYQEIFNTCLEIQPEKRPSVGELQKQFETIGFIAKNSLLWQRPQAISGNVAVGDPNIQQSVFTR